ncbi:uncharacterized protein TM35_000401430 [Trypanosoma theileri]|uniref:Uncharacterized protein n=1 Tax=Trypanosoma theileri TaxID=67003 RepID=A0A1X0NJM3_9TRYP|nr:uncharacterized protein TM35_000401430 [Trypanosoma theileri]ORC84876.1 hypothetical protein TM35_000401430 [Trypanosoma theileri]
MTGGVHVRAAAAVRTAVLWVSLCMLLQHLGHHPQFTAEAEGSVQVNIKRYFTIPNSKFASAGGSVTPRISATLCSVDGGSLVSGQSAAAQDAITVELRKAFPNTDDPVHTYMGGDSTYSIYTEPDPSKKCKKGFYGASLNCIYRWNIGVFASETVDGYGVPFYRGSYYTLPGRGPVNGYTAFWSSGYPRQGESYMVSRYWKFVSPIAKWYDSAIDSMLNPNTPRDSFIAVCEVQDGLVGNTSFPPAESETTWIQSHWYVPLIIAVVVLAAIIGLIILCCCLGGRNEEKYLHPMVIREVSNEPLRAREITDDGVVDVGYNNQFHDRSVSMVPSEPMPMEKMESANVSVYSVAENDVYGDGDVFSEGNR